MVQIESVACPEEKRNWMSCIFVRKVQRIQIFDAKSVRNSESLIRDLLLEAQSKYTLHTSAM